MRTQPPRGGTPTGERGFSLVEVLVVAALSAVLMAMAVVQIGSSRASMNADNAMRHVMSELNRARDTAVAQRRNVQITFPGVSNEIQTLRIGIAPEPPFRLLRQTFMEGNIRFMLPTGTPDTTDLFGAGSALDFDGALPDHVMFNSDGMLVHRTSGAIINGTIFLAAPNDQFATRAVTILGSTGRVRAYKRLNSAWGRV
jgi:prepilin-type N-terminal cleavage/methylation domain-containing protein